MPLFSAMAQPGIRINEKLNFALCFYRLNFDLRKTNEIYHVQLGSWLAKLQSLVTCEML